MHHMHPSWFSLKNLILSRIHKSLVKPWFSINNELKVGIYALLYVTFISFLFKKRLGYWRWNSVFNKKRRKNCKINRIFRVRVHVFFITQEEIFILQLTIFNHKNFAWLIFLFNFFFLFFFFCNWMKLKVIEVVFFIFIFTFVSK